MDIYLLRHGLKTMAQSRGDEHNLPLQLRKMIKLDDLYSRFDGSGVGHQSPQSLDQSYYTALQVDDLRKRDEDQVVLKWFRDKKTEFGKNLGMYSCQAFFGGGGV